MRVILSLTLQSLLFWAKKKKRGTPEKGKDFPIGRTPQILGKESKNAQNSKESRKMKEHGNRKKQGLEGQGRKLPQVSH